MDFLVKLFGEELSQVVKFVILCLCCFGILTLTLYCIIDVFKKYQYIKEE
jgi:hypothetical protein